MKKKIIAFYDVLLFAVVCAPLIVCSALIFLFGRIGDFSWTVEHWYFVLLFALGISIPLGGSLLLRYFIIHNGESAHFHYFIFKINWENVSNNIDARWNQDVFISEVKNVEIVKLTEEEKNTKVHYRHWFNKYLKIDLKYGNPKYVYVGNYSNFQIQRIVKLLTSKSG